ncbi:hypothetical protein CHUAL_009581 [Chamberlinius hualienensis]
MSRSARLNFAEGDTVMSKWPGSKKYYPAKITKIYGDKITIRFDDGMTVSDIAADDLKEFFEKSPRPIRRRSQGRQSSRSRSPSATRSSATASKKKPLGRPRRSKSRERASTPVKTLLDSSVVRRSPRVRVSRIQLDKVSDSEDDEVVLLSHSKKTRATSIVTTAKSKLVFPDEYEIKVSPKEVNSHPEIPQFIKELTVEKEIKDVTLNRADISDGKREAKTAKPKKDEISKHFGGSVGTFLLLFVLPFFVYTLNLIITQRNWNLSLPTKFPQRLASYFDKDAVAIYLGWILFQFILYTLPLGPVVKGFALKDGSSVKYRLNGLVSFVWSMLVLGVAIYYSNVVNLICNKFQQLVVTSICFSSLISVVLYWKSLRCSVLELSSAAKSGNVFYNLFMGRELNPSFISFDLKMFLELRPGLIGWAALNVCFLYKDYVDHQGYVSPNLALSAALQIFYVIDALYHEESILSTIDITVEGLGFMLTFGNLSFVPFIFTVQSRYLLLNYLSWQWYYLFPIFLFFVVGYLIFRLSNSQKDKFRRNPHGATVVHLKTISTGLPKKLLAGGWWGWVRHPNYLGDIIMAIAICLPTGFDSIIGYTYFIYLLSLLCHRAIRDDQLCAHKYGQAWETYRLVVNSRIFPHLF